MSGRRCLWIAASAAVLVLPACGSNDDDASPAAWADGLCVAMKDWKASIQSVVSTVTNVDELSKAKLEEAADDVSEANDELRSDVDELGEPPGMAAPEARAAVDELSSELEEAGEDVGNATGNLSSTADLVEAISITGGALQRMATAFSTTVAELQSLNATEEWSRAFSESSACQSLSSS